VFLSGEILPRRRRWRIPRFICSPRAPFSLGADQVVRHHPILCPMPSLGRQRLPRIFPPGPTADHNSPLSQRPSVHSFFGVDRRAQIFFFWGLLARALSSSTPWSIEVFAGILRLVKKTRCDFFIAYLMRFLRGGWPLLDLCRSFFFW